MGGLEKCRIFEGFEACPTEACAKFQNLSCNEALETIQSRLSQEQAMATKFETRCQDLFGRKLGMGRRWKTAAAQALGIGRATIYRYFEDDSDVPADVLARLGKLE